MSYIAKVVCRLAINIPHGVTLNVLRAASGMVRTLILNVFPEANETVDDSIPNRTPKAITTRLVYIRNDWREGIDMVHTRAQIGYREARKLEHQN